MEATGLPVGIKSAVGEFASRSAREVFGYEPDWAVPSLAVREQLHALARTPASPTPGSTSVDRAAQAA